MVRRSGRSHPNSQIISGARRFSQFCHQNQFYTFTCRLFWWTLRNCQISSGARCRYCITQIRKPFYLVFCLLFAYKHFCERRIGVGTFVFGARSSWLEFRKSRRSSSELFVFLFDSSHLTRIFPEKSAFWRNLLRYNFDFVAFFPSFRFCSTKPHKLTADYRNAIF